MEKKYVLAIDQSTQGTKAILFDKAGNMTCRTEISHRQIISDKGWVSHDLDEIYENVIGAAKGVVEKAGIAKEEIACLGLSNQRETSAAWDRKTGVPLAPAIVWQCSRAEEICLRVKDIGNAEEIRQKTGIRLSPYFPAAKYAWLIQNSDNVRKAKAEGRLCLGTIDSYLLFRLTGGKVFSTDYSNASRTQLFNIHTLKWDGEICGLFGVPTESLPKVCDSAFKYGETSFEGFFADPIPICGVIGDSQGALFGQCCIEKGMVKATYGTGSSVMMNIGEKAVMSDKGLVTSLAWGINGKVTYVLEGNINYTGAVISWLKDEIGLISSPDETQELAQGANPKDTAYLVPAFSGLGAPYWKTDARALLCGMSRTTGKKEIVKAALESIAYQITDIIEMMQSEGIEVSELHADGGPTKNQYLMKFQSDISEKVVCMPRCEASSAFGAGLLGGLACGFYSESEVLKIGCVKRFFPSLSHSERTEKYSGWKEAVRKAVG